MFSLSLPPATETIKEGVQREGGPEASVGDSTLSVWMA